MSLRLFLKPEAINWNDKHVPKLGKRQVYNGLTGPHIDLSGCELPETTSLPAELESAVVRVSYHDKFSDYASRKSGIYKHRSATAVLEHSPGTYTHMESEPGYYELRLEATNVADAAELYRLIRVGGICPIPSESFVEKQIELDSVRSVLKLAIDVIFRRLDDLAFRVFGS